MTKNLQNVVVLFALASRIAFGEIAVTEKSVTSEVTAGIEFAHTEFVLTNTGAEAIAIQRAEPNCECVTIQTKPSIIRAGKTEKIAADFEIGKRKGRHKKSIIVYTSDQKQSVILLQWTVIIRDP